MPSSTPIQDNPSPKTSKRVRWLSWVLVLAGLLLVGAGLFFPLRDRLTLMAHQPPPLPPSAVQGDFGDIGGSLADNPLPVLEMPPATPTVTASPIPTDTPVPPPADPSQPTATAAPTASPTLTPTPDPYPPAQSPPTRIVAPAIGLDSPVQKVGWHQESINGQTVSVWDVAEYAAGWHKNSALPGQVGNVVLSGHHNIKGEVFRYIVDLKPGDTITLYADDRPYDYVVTDSFIVKDKGEPAAVRRQNAQWIGPFSDKRLTLVTCWPYTSNTHRVIVIAKPAEK